ncbi:LysR family transcriptional regulator [Magnetospirillum fulvum]|uniref:LysR family transcriptional regulator n=1 Tax=Magnetospirillum fulvum TaxID=1082 RepID=UPI00058687E7|nr:LysR family transcriptional regulator [Magnetospirillum fulvum]
MRTLDLDSLHIFRAVVAEGGVVRAAARLNRVQSNVTTRIRQLEEKLGVALFRREGRGLRLTAEGEKLLPYAERLLRLAEEATLAMRSGLPLGQFRLGALESTAGVRLPPLLALYHARFPNVTVELSTGSTGQLLNRLLKFEIDAAFVSEPFSAPELEALPVFIEELALVAPIGASLADATQLARRTIIAFSQGCSYRRRLEEWLAAEKISPERVLEFASYQAMAACVAAGTGVAVMPRSVLRDLSAIEQVATHDLPPHIAANRTHLVWRAPSSPAVEALLSLLRSEAADVPPRPSFLAAG